MKNIIKNVNVYFPELNTTQMTKCQFLMSKLVVPLITIIIHLLTVYKLLLLSKESSL